MDKAEKQLEVRYFAALREQRGLSSESLRSSAKTPADLFAELVALHRLTLDPSVVRAAVGNDFVEMNHPLADGDAVTFIPPVAGG